MSVFMFAFGSYLDNWYIQYPVQVNVHLILVFINSTLCVPGIMCIAFRQN